MKNMTPRIAATAFFLLAASCLVKQLAEQDPAQEAQDTGFPDPILLDSVSWNHSQGCEFAAPFDFEQVLEAAAEEFGVDPRMLSTTVWRESDCKLAALGASGEIGLTQINPSVWTEHLAEHGIAGDLWDMKTNLRAGAYVLAYCQNRTDTQQQAFRCYNGSGPQAERYGSEQVVAYNDAWVD